MSPDMSEFRVCHVSYFLWAIFTSMFLKNVERESGEFIWFQNSINFVYGSLSYLEYFRTE